MKIAFQMDENINFETDTTFVLIKEAQRRKHEVFVYAPNNLALKLNHPIALAEKVSVDDFSFISKEDVAINLNEMDIIFIRQDPPFDMRYITTTYILEKTSALVINNPTEIRNCPEKLITSLFPELIPPTVGSRTGAPPLGFSGYSVVFTVGLNPNSYVNVSSSRLVKRSMRFSRTTLS